MYREHTKVISIGDKKIGGGNPVLIQSMCNTKTEDVKATVSQIHASGGRPAATSSAWPFPPWRRLRLLRAIKKQIHIPLVADIHFDYRLAIAAIESGADKIRINPGNIGARERVEAVVEKAKEYGIPDPRRRQQRFPGKGAGGKVRRRDGRRPGGECLGAR